MKKMQLRTGAQLESNLWFAASSAPMATVLDEFYLLSRRYLEINNRSYKRKMPNKWLHQRLAILVGQRGVGKTTMIVQHLLAQANGDLLSPEILYVPSDHFLLGKCSLYKIAEMFSCLGGKVIAFDEIHKYQDWSKELKSIYDTFPNLQIIASGSSALKIYQGTHDLTRRALVYYLPGLSFREYLQFAFKVNFAGFALADILQNHETIAREILNNSLWQKQKLLLVFKQYLRSGYFPYFLELKDQDAYLMTLEQNFHTVIEADMPAIYPDLTGNSIRKIKHLLTFIATAVPFMPQMRALKNILEVGDERTLKVYLKYLEDGGLIRMLQPATTKMSKIEAPEKIYLDNPNQFYAFSANVQNVNIGTIREAFFLNMLSVAHEVTAPSVGDFMIDNKILFEIGGRGKGFTQIKNEKQAYLALDEMEIGIAKKIPLWLFGFLY